MTSYEFGPFRLDHTERRLLRDGKLVALAPKVFDTLVALVENPGRLLQKDDLIVTLWPDSFVEEGTLARNISDLRKALGESSGDGKYIDTVPKSGYRFVAEVRLIEPRDSRSTIIVQKDAEAPVKSIAVLPLKALHSKDADEHLGLGMADALITRLSNIRQIAVRPTSAVLRCAGAAHDPITAGHALKVEAVLDGAIQQSGDRVRVTVQLISISSETPLWAGTFDEQFTDIFAVEDSISEQVARALTLKLTGEERQLIAKRYTNDSDAYALYLKGRYYWNKRTTDGLERSIDCFNRAIEIDDGYALAFAGLADSYTLLGDVGFATVPPKEAFSRGKKSANRALDIDNTLAEARASLAHIHMHCYEWPDARLQFEKTIELNPNYAHARQLRAFYLAFQGFIEEGHNEMRRALRLDPLSLPINMDLGVLLYLARDYDGAIDQYQQTLDMDRNFDRAHFWLGEAYQQKRMFDEAIAEYKTTIELSGGSREARAALCHAHAEAGHSNIAKQLLAELQEESSRKYISPYDLAIISVGLGDLEMGVKWLRRACDEHDGWMIYVSVDPRLDPLRSDPRFTDLLRRVGFRE